MLILLLALLACVDIPTHTRSFMPSTVNSHDADDAAANYLAMHGYPVWMEEPKGDDDAVPDSLSGWGFPHLKTD